MSNVTPAVMPCKADFITGTREFLMPLTPPKYCGPEAVPCEQLIVLSFAHLHPWMQKAQDRWVHVSFLCSSSGIGSNFNDSMMPLPVLEVELLICSAVLQHGAVTMHSPCSHHAAAQHCR